MNKPDSILVAAIAGQRHELAEVWASFYPAANAFAVGLADTLPLGWDWLAEVWVDRVADCIAALSPQVAWDYNMVLAARAVELYARGDHNLSALRGHTRANIRNAASALNGNGPGNGPKVNAFARNIRGDDSVVTVDRHMLVVGGYSATRPTRAAREDVARRTVLAARRIGESPATTQAIIWGYHRYTKGLQTYWAPEV